MPSAEFAEKIREEIIEAGIDDRYKPGAYEFVLHGLEFYQFKIGEKRHLSGQELAMGLLMFAHKQYGLMAKTVFDHWGVKTTEDLGCIVYNMIKIGLMHKQPKDSLEDFFAVTNISEFFEIADKECFTIDREYVRKIRA
ncbi:MAG: hypothetical protein LBU70_09915 [Chitinispirillales bacterium]|jgi:uncharacterized repeat protein (TIGR04138 family)|nr:hypothetical protein [Chitinispirillales bacterium]